nr:MULTISPECIES: IPTL-CTERM sorting domain-containing protein [unclassified Acidovorax]
MNPASDSGSSSADGLTAVTTPTLRLSLAGTGAVAGDSVEVLLGGAPLRPAFITPLSGANIVNGYIDVTVPAGRLGAEGSKVFTMRAINLAGNVGGAAGSLTITLDTTRPAAPAVPVLHAASDSGSSNSDRITNVTTPSIGGTAEAGSIVKLYEGATWLGMATAAGDGAWSIHSSALASGVHSLIATATDGVGNVSDPSGPLSITIDTKPLVLTGAVAGDEKVTLAWSTTAANATGSYTVTGTPAGTCTAATTSCTVPGLTNGTTYQFTVKASGAGGVASAPISATPVRTEFTGPVPGVAGTAAVSITGGGNSCTLTSAGFNAVVPPNAPAGATQPVGVFRFSADGCPGDTLSVSLTYPQPLPARIRFMKFGPPATGRASSWFELQPAQYSLSSDRRSVKYTVTDNQAGDSNTAPGAIEDPFAPMVLQAPAGVTGVPTLSQWSLMLMCLLVGLMAWRMRRMW